MAESGLSENIIIASRFSIDLISWYFMQRGNCNNIENKSDFHFRKESIYLTLVGGLQSSIDCGHCGALERRRMSTVASEITGILTVYSISSISSGAHQRKHQKYALLALCEGISPVTDGFTSQSASNAKKVSMSWRHHGIEMCHDGTLLYQARCKLETCGQQVRWVPAQCMPGTVAKARI